VYSFTREETDLDPIRERIKKRTDDQLMAYGCSAAWMASHNDGGTGRVQLAEARAEWRRGIHTRKCRHPNCFPSNTAHRLRRSLKYFWNGEFRISAD